MAKTDGAHTGTTRRLRVERYDRFALEYVRTGCAEEAYRRAGFGARTPKSCSRGACRLLKRPEVQRMVDHYRQIWKGFKREADALLLSETVGTVKALIALRDHATSETVRVRACTELLNRAGVLKVNRPDLSEAERRQLTLAQIIKAAGSNGDADEQRHQGIQEEVQAEPDLVLGDDTGQQALGAAEGDSDVGEGQTENGGA